jgi:hypothetical protein
MIQKARLARLHQTKLTARKALVDGKRRIDNWQKSGMLKMPEDGDSRTAAIHSDLSSRLTKKDIFEIQHYHLLNCLERTTVNRHNAETVGRGCWRV